MATPVNKAIFNLVEFLQRRWKLLTLGVSFIVVVRWVQNHVAKTKLIHSAIESFDPPRAENPSYQRGLIFHPECMNHWVNKPRRREEIRDYFHTKFNKFEASLIIPTTTSKESRSYQCNEKLEVLPRIVVSETRENTFDQFSQFAKYYFRLYSMILWQRKIYSLLTKNETCIHQFQILSKYTSIWKELKKDSYWMKQLLLKVNTASQYNTITSDLSDHSFYIAQSSFPTIKLRGREGYFLHPSDATLLTSLVLGSDPCQLEGKAEQLARKPINILVVNRKYSRSIHNLENVTNLFEEFKRDPTSLRQPISPSISQHSHYNHSSVGRIYHRTHPEIGKVSTTYFERKTMVEQAAEVHEADVILSVHGTQLTNFIFMKPCSIVIEIMPWLYNISSDFRQFSSSADILYYSWGVGHSESFFLKRNVRDDYQENPCIYYQLRYKRVASIESLSSVDLTNFCFEDGKGECTYCAKKVTEIQIDLEKLRDYFSLALKDRRRCIHEHPFYNHH